MKFKGFLITVSDTKRSSAFYSELFGLEVIKDYDGNVLMSGGLYIQEESCWKKFLGRGIISKNNSSELYFECKEIESFIEKLEKSGYPFEYVNPLMTHSWGQRVVRFYDPDGNLIEVGTPIN